MENSHKASAIAQIVFYAPIVPIMFYVGVRVWMYGPRLAWYPAMTFACGEHLYQLADGRHVAMSVITDCSYIVRLVGGALALASQNDPKNTRLITATIVLLNIGLVPLLMPFHALTRTVLEASLPESKRGKKSISVTRWLLLGAVVLLSTAGALTGNPEIAQTQSILSKVAYFEFVFVLLALIAMAVWLNFWCHEQIKNGQIVYIQWLLISSPFLCIRAVFGVISVFDAAGVNIRTSIWSPMFGSALLFSLMALFPEYIVLCVFVYLGIYRISTADRYGLIAQKGLFRRTGDTKSRGERVRGSTEMA
ncbi:hypothetical protein PG993_006909 [Apiospora rasikravindrae]|uniref:DUF7702 domain-containing protein n=1 Tax=Apiospora rasikravindrae TaxID=990691 RepID=A0ABR1SW13_9PEZI